MYTSLSQWTWDFHIRARNKGDMQRVRLCQIEQKAWRLVRAVQYEEAKAEFESGIRLARQLGEHWFEIILEYGMCFVCQQDGKYQDMLDRAIKVVARFSTQPELANHPHRAAIHQMLIRAYAEIDMAGYRDEMLEAMDFIENNLRMDRVTHMSIYYRRINLLLFFEEYEAAFDKASEYLSLSENNVEQRSVAHRLLSQYYFAKGDVVSAMNEQKLCTDCAHQSLNMRWEALSVGFQAVMQGWLGQNTESENLYQRCRNLLEGLNQHDLVHGLTASYLISVGRDADAVAHSEKALAEARNTGSLDKTIQWHLARGYLFNRLGQSVADEVATARERLEDCRKPAWYLEKIKLVDDGRLYAYDWQIEQRKGD